MFRKHDFEAHACDDADVKTAPGVAAKGSAKVPGGRIFPHDVPLPPEIVLHGKRRTGEQQPHRLRPVSGAKDIFARACLAQQRRTQCSTDDCCGSMEVTREIFSKR